MVKIVQYRFGEIIVDNDLKSYLKNKDIDLVEDRTAGAVRKFNELVEKGVKVLGAFHLTC